MSEYHQYLIEFDAGSATYRMKRYVNTHSPVTKGDLVEVVGPGGKVATFIVERLRHRIRPAGDAVMETMATVLVCEVWDNATEEYVNEHPMFEVCSGHDRNRELL